MALHKLVVLTNAVDGLEDEYNRWYSDRHLDDVLKVPTFVAAQRFKISAKLSEGKAYRYLAIYEIETDDPEASLTALRARGGTDAMVLSEGLDRSDIYAMLYAPITEVVHAKGGEPA